jgi:hypothetical protein
MIKVTVDKGQQGRRNDRGRSILYAWAVEILLDVITVFKDSGTRTAYKINRKYVYRREAPLDY